MCSRVVDARGSHRQALCGHRGDHRHVPQGLRAHAGQAQRHIGEESLGRDQPGDRVQQHHQVVSSHQAPGAPGAPKGAPRRERQAHTAQLSHGLRQHAVAVAQLERQVPLLVHGVLRGRQLQRRRDRRLQEEARAHGALHRRQRDQSAQGHGEDREEVLGGGHQDHGPVPGQVQVPLGRPQLHREDHALAQRDPDQDQGVRQRVQRSVQAARAPHRRVRGRLRPLTAPKCRRRGQSLFPAQIIRLTFIYFCVLFIIYN